MTSLFDSPLDILKDPYAAVEPSKLQTALEAGRFVITGEIAPPAGLDYHSMYRSVQILGSHTTAINVTDNQGANLRLSSMAASNVVRQLGYEPIFQVTCRDRNRLGLQSDLMAAWTLGLKNVLLVSGDSPKAGDHPDAKPVYDLNSIRLIEACTNLNKGILMNGKDMIGKTGFFIGAVCFPEARLWDSQLRRIHRKVDAGAKFFQTQIVMETGTFIERAPEIRATGAKLIASILLLKSPGVVRFLNNKLPGVTVPQRYAERIETAVDPLDEAVQIALEQMDALRPHVDGFHLMPLGSDELVPKLLRELDL